jgi:hypothetical protein
MPAGVVHAVLPAQLDEASNRTDEYAAGGAGE